ncbi:MAG: GNAT family N-acetyltransferase [Polyangiales bacterium]
MIRCLRPDEIEAVVPLLRAAYQRDAPYSARLRRYLSIEPEGWFAMEGAEQIIGMVGVVLHGAAAYVGLMAVDPAHQGRKLGRVLMDHALAFARERGSTLVMLDASEAGFPLYLRCGFVEREKTLDTVCERPRSELAHVEHAAFEELLPLDRALFGADRSRTLRQFAADHAERTVVVRAKGRVVAYAIAQDSLIGPIVAEDDASARAVVEAATSLPFEAPPRIIAPESRGPLLESLGFRTTRALRHMRLGGPDIPYRVIGKASMAVG